MDYPYIRVWHKMTGSFQYYIDMQVEQARKDKAPQTATYRDFTTGRWHTVEEVRDEGTKKALKARVDRLLEQEAAKAITRLNAEWIPYMKAYRLYDPRFPQQTVAYADTLEEAERPGYRIVEVDADTMHVECF